MMQKECSRHYISSFLISCYFRICVKVSNTQEHEHYSPLFLFFQMKNADYFSKFVTEDFTSYIHRKKNDYCHGNNVEIQALSEMYNRPIEIYVYSLRELLWYFVLF